MAKLLDTGKTAFRLVVDSATAWIDDGGPRLGASLAFYTVFSLAPVLVIMIAIAGAVFGREAAQGEIVTQIGGLIGETGAKAIEAMIESAYRSRSAGAATGLGIITLLLGASAVFGELSDALNIVWRYKASPRNALHRFLRHKLLSFSLVLGVGFLLMASLVVSAGVEGFNRYLSSAFPGMATLIHATDFMVSFAVITVLFALIFKVVPDAKVNWRDVWLGAAVTAALFNVGKHLIGLYLGNSGVTSPFGAAGSLAVIMLWVYYSAQIMLFGAEFTRVYSEQRTGRKRVPQVVA